MPIPRAIIDADTLYRRHPRNVLVWHALAGLFELHWSARIVAETRRNLVERNQAVFGEPRAAAVDRTLRRVTDALRLSGAGSLVPDEAIAVHEPHIRRIRSSATCPLPPLVDPAAARALGSERGQSPALYASLRSAIR